MTKTWTGDQRMEAQPVRYHTAVEGFHVGQEGDFIIRDSLKQPIETVRGKIISLMEGSNALYAMLQTDRGVRPGRLS